MANVEKQKYFNFYILNVKLRNRNSKKDVDPSEYVKLFKRVHDRKIHKPSSPSKNCIFKFMFQEKNDKKEVLYLSGTFAQFTFIQNERWFNLNSLDLDEEFHVPDGLFPDAKITEFVFIPNAHRFCYKLTNDFKVSPYAVKKFLEMALDEVCDQKHFVQVDVESDKASLKAIYAAREIRKLIIDINYSNFDIGNDLKQFVEEDIKSSNTSKLKIEATQKPNISIDIDKSKILSGAIESSISNGDTEATILNENNRVEKIKTSDFPRRESVYGLTTFFSSLVYEKIMKIFRSNGDKTNKRKS